MKYIRILIFIGSLSILYAEEFKDKYLKCTLMEADFNEVSERKAQAIGEFEQDLIITKTLIKYSGSIFDIPYDHTNDKTDIYSCNQFLECNAYYRDNKFYFFYGDKKSKYKVYSCRKDTLYEEVETKIKLKMK